MAAMRRDWDIFCRVIDNFGDIGVCWRLARQLASEHDLRVRLWVDDLNSLPPLCPGVDSRLAQQQQQGVEIRLWPENFPEVVPGSVVIEAFACELPDNYIKAMAKLPQAPCWLNLDYLTAENWASEWHRLPSPHPLLALRKTFFFPGFTAESGGLLREKGLFARRDNFLAQSLAQQKPKNTLDISLFCYDNAPVGDLLNAMMAGPQPIRCHIPPGKPLQAVAAHLGSPKAQTIGQLEILPLPFLPQDQYDELLWRCDINFVRGEDSFVRAQWAGQPFVWQIYPQEENAHWPKLEAFINLYKYGQTEEISDSFTAMQHAWNSGRQVASAWQDFLAQRSGQHIAATNWSNKLKKQDDLVSRLVKFAANPV
jgi:uncharacterized repeat protein (TIGR03837 family)